jgi:hypothetical protein
LNKEKFDPIFSSVYSQPQNVANTIKTVDWVQPFYYDSPILFPKSFCYGSFPNSDRQLIEQPDSLVGTDDTKALIIMWQSRSFALRAKVTLFQDLDVFSSWSLAHRHHRSPQDEVTMLMHWGATFKQALYRIVCLRYARSTLSFLFYIIYLSVEKWVESW